MMIPKQKPIRLQKLRDSARGAPCMIQGPTCNNNPETSVLAHYRSHDSNAGMGMKPDDTAAAIACSACHEYIGDGVGKCNERDRQFYWLRGILRTFRYWIEEGVLK